MPPLLTAIVIARRINPCNFSSILFISIFFRKNILTAKEVDNCVQIYIATSTSDKGLVCYVPLPLNDFVAHTMIFTALKSVTAAHSKFTYSITDFTLRYTTSMAFIVMPNRRHANKNKNYQTKPNVIQKLVHILRILRMYCMLDHTESEISN